MWLKKINYNKKQYLLLGFALFIIAAILTIAMGFTFELKVFSSKCINEKNSSDVLAIAVGSDAIEDILSDDEKAQIKSVFFMKGKYVSVPLTINSKDISQFYQMMFFMDGKENKYFSVDLNTSDNSPKSGEVWISKTIAKSNNVKIGDTLTLGYDDPIHLKISGFYTSSLTATASLCVTPIILSSEDSDKFDEISGALLALDLNTADMSKTFFSKNDYIVTSYTREVLKSKFTEISDLLGVVGVLAASIVFIMSLFVISFIIKNDINKQIKEIGIYKCLGYRNKTIVGFYLIGYLVVGIIMTSLGSLVSLPLVKYMCNLCTEYVEKFELTMVSVFCCIAVVFFMNILLVINLAVSLTKIRKITPVEAFNAGQNASVKRIPKSIIKNASTSLQVAFNDIFKYKSRSLMITFVFAICILLSSLFLKIVYSSSIMTDNPNLWFAVPKNNCYMFGNLDEKIIDWLDNKKEIKSYTYGDLNYDISAKINDKKFEDYKITFDVFNNISGKDTGILIDGDFPTENNIIISRNLINILNCDVGDKIKITSNDNSEEYKIVGTYTSLLSNYGIMMSIDGMKKIDTDYVAKMAFINLNENVDFDTFKKSTESEFSTITIDQDWFAMNNALSSVKTILFSISCILIYVFVMVSIIIVVIILMIENTNKRRQFGIMKAMGFRASYMISRNLFMYGIYGLIGVIIALSIHISFSNKLLTLVLINAFEDSYLYLAEFIIGFLLLLLITVYIMGIKIKSIKPVELMEN